MSTEASVVDLFCGAGGLSHGFHLEGITVAAGFDIDEACRFPFEANNKAPFIKGDVGELDPADIQSKFVPGAIRVLVGCAPCQPFSTYNQKNDDPNWQLLGKFGELITELGPDIVSMENVPRLEKFRSGEVFDNFVRTLKRAEYEVVYGVVYGPDFGLPQTRSRLVLLASRLGKIEMPTPTHVGRHVCVKDVIAELPVLSAGAADGRDNLHRASRLSETNLRRIRQAKPGGTWRQWEDKSLIVNCHQQESGRGYASVYGRMSWDRPSPTITTQFFGFGNGRFGHPEQDRALSLREGALLQSFPRDYQFVPMDQPVQFKKVGRMIGNAVPVSIGRAIARAVRKHLESLKDNVQVFNVDRSERPESFGHKAL